MYVNQVVKDYLGEGLISTLPEAAQEQIAYMKWAFDKFYTKTPVSALRKTSLVTF
jgi:hypothetical protein